MGILPLQFKDGEGAESLGLTGSETFTIERDAKLTVNQSVIVKSSTGKQFQCMTRLDTEPEIAYYTNGGILQYVLRKLINEPAPASNKMEFYYFPAHARGLFPRLVMAHLNFGGD